MAFGISTLRKEAAAPAPTNVGSQPLIGPAHQTAGGVWVVDSDYEVDRLYERLTTPGEVFGLDTETRDINPKEMSPAVGKGWIVVWSCAFFDERLGTHPLTGYPLAQRVFVQNWGIAEEKRWLYKFQPWFEDHKYKKVGANFFSFDKHVFKNHAIDVHGIVFDNTRGSKLNDVSQLEHGLKVQGLALGYVMREYSELFMRPKIKRNGQPGKDMVLVPLLEVVKDPAWLATLIDYASMDAKVSLEAWPPVADKLKRQPWRNGQTMLDYYNVVDNPYYYVLSGAEEQGWDLDETWCNELAIVAERDMGKLERELVEWTGVVMNFGSPTQIGHYLYGTTAEQVVKANPNIIPGRGFPIPPVTKSKKKPKPWEDPDPENPFRPTDAVALQWLADNVRSKRDRVGLRKLLEWRKIKDTNKYLVGLPKFQDARGRVHCMLGPDTDTGRLAARKPALQQIPVPGKDPIADRYMVREAFTCSPGEMLIGADYSQLEMRILAHFLIELFDDHKLADDLQAADLHSATSIRVFSNPGFDVPEEFVRKYGAPPHITHWDQISAFAQKTDHGDPVDTAKWLNELPYIPIGTPVKVIKTFFFSFRNKGKIVNFSVNYGKTAWGLGYDLRDSEGNPIGEEAAQKILDAYFEAYPAILRYKKWSINYATKHGYARTLDGRYRPLPHIWDRNNGVRGHAERQAQNTPIQGSAADIAKKAQLKTNTLKIPELLEHGWFDEELYRMEVKHIMQIHDELIFKCPKDNAKDALARVTAIMEDPLDKPLRIPLPVAGKYGMTWREVK